MTYKTLKCAAGAALTVLALSLPSTSAWGNQRFSVPQTPLPLYAAGLGDTGTNVDDWIVTAFYYSPAHIPGDYDLSNIPAVYPPVGVELPYVEGFFVMGDKNPFPVQLRLRNAPGALIPIWFTRLGDWTGTWTVNELQSQNPMVGWADYYTETDEPASVGMHSTIVASGLLENGHRFWVQSTITRAWWEDHATAQICRLHIEP